MFDIKPKKFSHLSQQKILFLTDVATNTNINRYIGVGVGKGVGVDMGVN
jgi:hypothetical protein